MKQIAAQKLRGGCIRNNTTFFHQDNAVNISIQDIFQTVFNNQNCFILLAVNLIDQINRKHAHAGVKRSQGLVKQKKLDITMHNTGKGNTLLLTAGEVIGNMFQEIAHTDNVGCTLHQRQHIETGHIIIFKGVGNIFTYRKTNELGIRILEDGSDTTAQTKKAGRGSFHASDFTRSLNLTGE